MTRPIGPRPIGFMQALANADITNWARAILVVDATRTHDAFVFRAAKRGRRIGWADEDGNRVYERLFCHHGGDAIFWRDATDEDEQRVALAKSGAPRKYTHKQLLDLIAEKALRASAWQKRADEEYGMSRSVFYDMKRELEANGAVESVAGFFSPKCTEVR